MTKKAGTIPGPRQAQDLKQILLKAIKLSGFEMIQEDMADTIWHRYY